MTQHYTTLNGSPLSNVAFGTMQFGGGADAAQSQAMFEACLARDIRHFDTANGYTEGASETILGKLAKDNRDALFIATKCGYVGGAGRHNILTQFDQSRARLGMDVVDLLYMHRFDDDAPLEETFETLAGLQESGKIRFVGVSNYAAWQVMKAQAIAQGFGTRIDVIQPMYNLVKRQVEVEILPMCQSEGILAATYSPLGGGLLTGKYVGGGREGRLAQDNRYAARYGLDEMHATAAGLADMARELGTDPATLAVAWVMRHSAQPAPILSARTPDQLAPSLEALEFAMDDALYARVSSLSRTPAPATDRLEEA